MEIKTESEIWKKHESKSLIQACQPSKKWVAVDDIYREIDNCGEYTDDGSYDYDFVKIETLLSKLKGQ